MTHCKKPQIHFTLHCFDPPKTIGPDEFDLFTREVGLQGISDRISRLLLTQIISYSHKFQIPAERITSEIKHLEGISGYENSITKPASLFSETSQLSGVYHKHFTASTVSMVAANVSAARPRKILKTIAQEELYNKTITPEVIAKFTNRIVIDGYERRLNNKQLTGEWIIFIEHENQKYYLCLATHAGGNNEIINYFQTAIRCEFPFLVDKFPKIFN